MKKVLDRVPAHATVKDLDEALAELEAEAKAFEARQLTPEQKKAVADYYTRGVSGAKIADILGVDIRAVRNFVDVSGIRSPKRAR